MWAAAVGVEMLVWGGDGAVRGDVATLPSALIVLAACAAYAPLLLWRERPWWAFGSAWAFAIAIGVAVPSYEPFAGLLLGLYAVARRCSSRQGKAALLATGTPFALATFDAASFDGPPAVVDLAVIGGFWAMASIGVWLVGRIARRAERQAKGHAAALAAAEDAARRAERVGIARELHDIVAHALSGIVVQAAGARAIHAAVPGTPEPVARALRDIEAAGAEAMRELHRLLGLLREAGLADEHGVSHRLAEMNVLVGRAQAVGLDVAVTATGAPVHLDGSVEHAAYRVLQESLSNAMKHTGRGGRVDVDLTWMPDGVDVVVRTRAPMVSAADGVPFSSDALRVDGPAPDGSRVVEGHRSDVRPVSPADRPAGGPTRGAAGPPGPLPETGGRPRLGGHGLAGLRERVHLAGGHFEAGPVPGGFETRAHLPARGTHSEPAGRGESFVGAVEPGAAR